MHLPQMSQRPMLLRDLSGAGDDAEYVDDTGAGPRGPAASPLLWAGGVLGMLLLAIAIAGLVLLGLTYANSTKIHGSSSHHDMCEIERSVDGSLDDRCPPCEQANEQQKLNNFVLWQLREQFQLYGTYAWSTLGTLAFVDEPSNQDPLFPDVFQKMWDRIHNKAQHINLDLLDPYDASAFNITYLRRNFYGWRLNETAQVAVCERRFEDQSLPTVALTPANTMFGTIGAAFGQVPTQLMGAWILDAKLFAYYVGQLEQSISAINARVSGDWWTAVAQRIQANGGVFRDEWANQHLGAIAIELSLTDPLAMPQPVKQYIANNGYIMSPAEEAYLDDVLTRYFAAQTAFFAYSTGVLPSLVDPMSFVDWARDYGWSDCFGYANGVWAYNMNVDDLAAFFADTKARSEALSASLLVQRDNLWPAAADTALPFLDSWLHYVFPEGYPNPLNISGWGLDPQLCDDIDPVTGLPLFAGALNAALARYYGQSYKLYLATTGTTPQYDGTFIYGGCAPFSGAAFTNDPYAPPTDVYTVPKVLVNQGPFLTFNLTFNTVVHEQKHVSQSMLPAGACPTCYGIFQTSSQATLPVGTQRVPFVSNGLNAFLFTEGSAQDAEARSVVAGMTTAWETFHQDMFQLQFRLGRSAADIGIRIGYWTVAEANTWFDEHMWFPIFNPAGYEAQVLSDLIPQIGWYTLGEWKIQRFREQAQIRCGDAFDERAFNTLTQVLPYSPSTTWDLLFHNYINAGCVSATTRFGDARRTVVAPSLQS